MPEIFNSLVSTNYFLCLLTAFLCGCVIAAASAVRQRVSAGFLAALVLLPMIVCTVILMVNGNIGTGVAVMGAFSLVRFRSVPGKARDIVVIFMSMTAGLACAAGQLGVAAVFTLAVCAVMVLLAFAPVKRELELRITVPETLQVADAFADIFAEYTKSCHLVHTKTTNMGSLYKLQYRLELKDNSKIQEFVDKLRTRNGNLEIAVGEAEEGSEAL
ncbi:MAG: DUF4956 domain-containing protein [Oscillospiraceae bacterium]|nr:DUF4956 domain-containing protein [Oscillospiraceae bacterium]